MRGRRRQARTYQWTGEEGERERREKKHGRREGGREEGRRERGSGMGGGGERRDSRKGEGEDRRVAQQSTRNVLCATPVPSALDQRTQHRERGKLTLGYTGPSREHRRSEREQGEREARGRRESDP